MEEEGPKSCWSCPVLSSGEQCNTVASCVGLGRLPWEARVEVAGRTLALITNGQRWSETLCYGLWERIGRGVSGKSPCRDCLEELHMLSLAVVDTVLFANASDAGY